MDGKRKTPLYGHHLAAGGRMVPFAGYLLPVQYADMIREHKAVRTFAGLFDVSHMGELVLSGPDAPGNLERLLTNSFAGLGTGCVRYSLMCNEQGGVVDDLLVYRIRDDTYCLVVNAANRGKDLEWLKERLTGDVRLEDLSDAVAQIALQGPLAQEILGRVAGERQLPQAYYSCRQDVPIAGTNCAISRTGYTGEDGYELYCPATGAGAVWDALLEAGEKDGLLPCGLGARDTLRLEAGMPLYGHELSEEISPLEARLGFAVRLEKPDFVGKQALQERGEPQVRRVGLKITGRGIAREQNPVLAEGRVIGKTTSGTYLPYLDGAYAMALVSREYDTPGTELEVEVRGKRIAARVVPLPFYKKMNGRPANRST